MKFWGGKKKPQQIEPFSKEEDFVDWDYVWAQEEARYGIEPEEHDDSNYDDADYNEEVSSGKHQHKKRAQKPTNTKIKKHHAEQKSTSHRKKQKKEKKHRNEKKKHHFFRNVIVFLIITASLYSIIVFSDIPFIAKWRAIYIETAMSTMSHQWLATAFFPKSVIDSVMSGRYNLDEEQSGLVSNWGVNSGNGFGSKKPWESDRDYFFRVFHEIDEKTFDEYVKKYPDSIYDENGNIFIDNAGLDDDGTTIHTKQGDQVLAIDTVNGILVVKTTGEGYVGRLAIVKDASRVGLGLAKGFGNTGAGVEKLAKFNNAILSINASGFEDPNGTGNGGKAYGLVISNGKRYQKLISSGNKIIAFDYENRLHIGQYKNTSGFRDAVEFKPALIINGKKLVKGSAGWGIQPRSAIGQTEKGEVLMLVIDGRAPGYSIGATLGDCADIMEDYDAIQACNLDGGSSSIMYYNGREISKPSAANKVKGRAIPNGFMVFKK